MSQENPQAFCPGTAAWRNNGESPGERHPIHTAQQSAHVLHQKTSHFFYLVPEGGPEVLLHTPINKANCSLPSNKRGRKKKPANDLPAGTASPACRNDDGLEVASAVLFPFPSPNFSLVRFLSLQTTVCVCEWVIARSSSPPPPPAPPPLFLHLAACLVQGCEAVRRDTIRPGPDRRL